MELFWDCFYFFRVREVSFLCEGEVRGFRVFYLFLWLYF